MLFTSSQGQSSGNSVSHWLKTSQSKTGPLASKQQEATVSLSHLAISGITDCKRVPLH